MIRQILLFLVAVQVLNMSMGCIEFTPLATIRSNTSPSNDFDSFLEYISENVMGYENSFPETYDQEQQKSSSTHQLKSIYIKLVEIKKPVTSFELPASIQSFILPQNDYRVIDYSAEINPPPPKA